jgi:hypothetical protein
MWYGHDDCGLLTGEEAQGCVTYGDTRRVVVEADIDPAGDALDPVGRRHKQVVDGCEPQRVAAPGRHGDPTLSVGILAVKDLDRDVRVQDTQARNGSARSGITRPELHQPVDEDTT